MISYFICIIIVLVINVNYLEISKIMNKMIDNTTIIMINLNVAQLKSPLSIDKNTQ